MFGDFEKNWFSWLREGERYGLVVVAAFSRGDNNRQGG